MPWVAAAATGVGSMPGTSAIESARIVAGELPDLLHVVELPARGPGADMVGRTAGMLALVDSSWGMETTPGGWRVAGSRGTLMRRARALLGEDLDALEEVAQGYRGPVKSQITGPWTMAASVELASGERVLRDPGAVLDLAEALAEAAVQHVADLRRRMPRASALVVQVDEPWLPSVLTGSIDTASGLSRYAPVDPQVAGRLLGLTMRAIDEAGGVPGVHCCAKDAPIPLLREAGAAFVSVDITRSATGASGVEAAGALHAPGLGGPMDADLGVLLESGGGLVAGALPSQGTGGITDTRASAPIRALLHRLGLEDDRILSSIAVSPTCGLAGASAAWARTALSACGAVGRVLRQDDAMERRADEVDHES